MIQFYSHFPCSNIVLSPSTQTPTDHPRILSPDSDYSRSFPPPSRFYPLRLLHVCSVYVANILRANRLTTSSLPLLPGLTVGLLIISPLSAHSILTPPHGNPSRPGLDRSAFQGVPTLPRQNVRLTLHRATLLLTVFSSAPKWSLSRLSSSIQSIQ